MENKDAKLKKAIKHVLENCEFEDSVLDTEVHLNWSGERDASRKLIDQKEIDVVVVFTYRGRRIMLFFECEDSSGARGIRKEYSSYDSDISEIQGNLSSIKVLHSGHGTLKGRHFREVEFIRACFCYGAHFPEASYQACLREAKKHSYAVWNHLALNYYGTISSILRAWTRYEIFKDLQLDLEGTTKITIKALEVKQKGKVMYVGTIHPGQLLKIAYVVRRASEKTYAYQRMLNGDRIKAIGDFISSHKPQAFLPNAVIAVLDEEDNVQYDSERKELTMPLVYCSAWIIDGQHRAYGFLHTEFEKWEPESFRPFELPIILFRKLPFTVQTETFININYYQNKIKPGLLCDLTTLTKDLSHKLTWPSLIGRELDRNPRSKLNGLVKISELHRGRPINLASLVQFGLLETLLGYRSPKSPYDGPLYAYAKFNPRSQFGSKANKEAFQKHVELLIRFLAGVYSNTTRPNLHRDPWKNHKRYSLLKPTGLNALFLVLAKILRKHPNAGLDFQTYLRPLNRVRFRKEYVANMGGGWKGFRKFANVMLRMINARGRDSLGLYGRHGKT